MTTETLSLAAIRDLSRSALLANGLEAQASEIIADIVTRAEADACRSHGLYRIEGYVAGLRSGRINPGARPRIEKLRPGMIRVNADGGFAPVAAEAARQTLIAATRECGIAAMAITQAHHFSALWADLEPLVDAGLVAWAFVVGQCSVAPHGGKERLMGTNPMGFGWPRPGKPAFLFDFATSGAARGEVELKRIAGEPLPPGWAIDKAGAPTTDPAEALAGALLPFGGHKGSALSMMVELIAAPLIGELTSRQVAAMNIADGGPPPGGELLIALDPQVFAASVAAEVFFADAEAQAGLRLPAARRHLARRRSQVEGVTVPVDLVERIRALVA